jgi:hypothetical protein
VCCDAQRKEPTLSQPAPETLSQEELPGPQTAPAVLQGAPHTRCNFAAPRSFVFCILSSDVRCCAARAQARRPQRRRLRPLRP